MFENKNINTKVSESEKNSSSTTQMAQIDVAQLVELDELSYSKTLNSSISLLQKKANTSGNNNRLYQLQEKAFSKEIYGNSSNSVIQRKGLPNTLQKGVENLSGQSMDDVKVHYNSDKPAKLGAHAYAQGTDIHLGKGQEKHLPHEAWHVVQQKEGRVKPTVQKKEKIPINDDTSLETEADIMGSKALNFEDENTYDTPISSKSFTQNTIQKVENDLEENEQEQAELDSEEKASENESKGGVSDDNSEGEDNKDQDSSAQVDIKPETLVLSGTKGLYAKVSSFFGKETSFGTLQNLIKEYEDTEDDTLKEELKPKIVNACETWLKKHPKPKKSKSFFGKLKSGFNRLRGKTKNDDKKRQSIELIKKRFSETKKASDIKLTTLADKQSITSKIKGVFGFKTTFKQIEDQYHQYQSEASSISSFSSLLQVLEKAKQIFMLIDQWKQSHTELTDKDEKARFDSLTKIENGILNLFFQTNFKNIITLKVSKLSLSQLRKNKVAMEELELTINIEGKKITGKGEDIVLTKEGIDFSKLTIDYNDNIKITEGFEVSKPKLMVSHQGENYSVTAYGGIGLNMKIPNAELSAQGGVEVTYNTQTAKFSSPKLSNAEILASLFGGNLELSASGIDYSNGFFIAKSGSATLKHFDVNSNVEDLTFSKKDGFDWSKIEINVDKGIGVGSVISIENAGGMVKGRSDNYAYEISGDLGVNVSPPDGFSLEASGNVTVSGNPIESDYNVSVNGDGEIIMSLGDLIKANAKQISFDKSKEELSAGSASLSLNLFQNKNSADLKSLKVSKKDGVDWDSATFKFDKIGLDGLVSVKDVAATVKGKNDNYEKNAEGTLDLDSNLIPGATINAEGIQVSMNVKDGKWSFGLNGDSLGVSMLNDSLKLISSKLKYENKKFEMETLEAFLSLPGRTIQAEGSNVIVEKDNIDWDQIKFPMPKILPKLGPLEFDNGDAIIKGKKESYALGLDVKTSFESENINWLTAEGKANLLWNYREKKLPEVTEYDLNVNAKSPKIPDAFLPPGTWPISFSLVMPFAAGPVPMEAEVGFEASAGASLGLSGSIQKMGDSTNISAQGTGNAEVVISIVGSVGVGSKYLVKLAGFLKGSAIANAGLSLGLNGEINNEFNFVSLEGDYSVDANFMAKLSAGLEAKALLIFQKTLYEVTLKKWELGSSKKEGKYDFLENKEKESQTTGLFKGRNISKDDLNNAPEVQHNTKEYLQAMEKFSKILNEENSTQKIEESDDKEALFDSSIINEKKTKLVNVLEAVIDENLSNKEFLKFKKKISRDENKLNRKKELHKEQMERQYEKLEAAKEGKLSKYKTIIKGRNEDHYKRKIERLKNEYKSKVEKDLIKLSEYRMKTDIYQNQINAASTYLSNIDPILENPELSISIIDQQISEYREINERANEQRYSIENYLTDLDFANANIDYED